MQIFYAKKSLIDLKQTKTKVVGIYDPLVFRSLNYSICPNNRFFNTKKFTDFVTDSKGVQEAVAEAVLHVLEKFFEIDVIFNLQISKSASWQ